MTPREFVLHWHREARVAPPRFVPDSWERQADAMMGKGITAEDLTLVARWMLTQLGRSQGNERNAVAFNAASFRWTLMMGEWGASNQHERFLEILASAEAARPKRLQAARHAPHQPCSAPASPVDEAQAKAYRDEVMRKFREKMEGGTR